MHGEYCADWDVGEGNLKSITGYLGQDNIITARDQDAGSIFTITNVSLLLDQYKWNDLEDNQKRRFLSQELQYSSAAFEKLDYTIGLFYSKEDINDSPQGFPNSQAGFLGLPDGDLINVFPPAIVGFRTTSLSDFDNKTLAAFAQGIWHFDEKWSLTVGGRYGEEKKTVKQQNIVSLTPSPGLVNREEFDSLLGTIHDLVPAERLSQDKKWRQFTPAVTVSYIAGDDFLDASNLDSLLVYMTYSEGFKAGGFSSFDGALETFEPEEITNYELGLKIDALDGRLRFNTALYYMEYQDMQITVTRAVSDIQTENGTFNAGQANMGGVEAELHFAPTANWLFQLSANYIHAKYDEFEDISAAPGPDSASCASIQGAAEPGSDFLVVDRSCEDFAYLPKTTFYWAGQYSFESDWGLFTALVNGSYRDEIYIGLEAGADAADESILDDFTVWNARLSWQTPGELDLNVALYLDNFTDEKYFGTGNLQLRNQGSASLVRGLPRTYGIQARYRF